MSVKFEVKMTDKIMYDFLLYHTYTHIEWFAGSNDWSACLGWESIICCREILWRRCRHFILAALFFGGDAGFPERKGKDTGTKNEDVSKAIRI